MGNLHLVTGYAGEPHVAAADQGSLFEALIRSGQFVMEAGANFAASVVTNNQIRVSDGELLMQGRHVKMNPGTYVDLTIENGAQGYLRNDLIVARYTKNSGTGIEECSLVVLKGTQAESNPSDPQYTTGNINADGAMQHDFPLYRVPLSGLNVGNLVALFEPQKSIFDYNLGAFAPSGYGLGGRSVPAPENDANKITRCGFYRAFVNTPTSDWWTILQEDLYGDGTNMIQHATCFGQGIPLLAERIVVNSNAKEWEWVNPPMVAGVEYRTIERYKGSAVYKKVNSNGDVLWRKDGETQWHLLSSASYVAAATVE